MQITHCNELLEEILKDPCNYQFNAIDQKEIQAIVEAHLKQEHAMEFENFSSQDLADLVNSIDGIMVS